MKLPHSINVVFLCCSMLAVFAADSPKLLPFQGRLKTAQGSPVPDGNKVVQFKIYDAPVGGSVTWNGEVHNLTVNNGNVSTTLGSRSALDRVDFNRTLYLEITIDANNDNQITSADPPLLPRQSILPVIFASEAAESRKLAGHDWSALFGVNDPTGNINGARIGQGTITSRELAASAVTSREISPNSVNSTHLAAGSIQSAQIAPASISLEHLKAEIVDALVPPGTIIAFGAEDAPSGWLPCDGAEYRISDYPRLAATIGKRWGAVTDSAKFRVPDFRGWFLRGWNQGSPYDPEAGSRFALGYPAGEGGATGDHVGTYQWDALQNHAHNFHFKMHPASGGGSWANPTIFRWDSQLPDTGDEGNTMVQQATTLSGSDSVRTAVETRSRNASVYYVIKQ